MYMCSSPSFFLFESDLFCLLTVGLEGYCCTWSLSMTHTQNRQDSSDEESAQRIDLYLKTHNIHKRQASMTPAGFKWAISASERPQNYTLDHSAAGIGQ